MRQNPTSNPPFSLNIENSPQVNYESIVRRLVATDLTESKNPEQLSLDELISKPNEELFAYLDLVIDHFDPQTDVEYFAYAMHVLAELLSRVPLPIDYTAGQDEMYAHLVQVNEYLIALGKFSTWIEPFKQYETSNQMWGVIHDRIDHDIKAIFNRAEIGLVGSAIDGVGYGNAIETDDIELINSELSNTLAVASHLISANASLLLNRPTFSEFSINDLVKKITQCFGKRTKFSTHFHTDEVPQDEIHAQTMQAITPKNTLVYGDPNLLFYMIFAAVKNAFDVEKSLLNCHYNELQLGIRIEVIDDHDCFRIEVSDTGHGVQFADVKQKRLQSIAEALRNGEVTASTLTELDHLYLLDPVSVSEELGEDAFSIYLNEYGATFRPGGTGAGLGLAEMCGKLCEAAIRVTNWRSKAHTEEPLPRNAFGAISSIKVVKGGIDRVHRSTQLVTNLTRSALAQNNRMGEVIAADIKRETFVAVLI